MLVFVGLKQWLVRRRKKLEDGPEKPHKLHYMQLFNIKLNGLHRNVRAVQGNTDWVAAFI